MPWIHHQREVVDVEAPRPLHEHICRDEDFFRETILRFIRGSVFEGLGEQPAGGSMGLGTSPSMANGSVLRCGSGSGTACSNARV